MKIPSICAVLLAALTVACTASRPVAQRNVEPQVAASAAATELTAGARPQQVEPVIVAGTGALFGTAKPRTIPAGSGDGFQISFIDTEISVVIASVVGDGLGKAYAIDPQVKGTMTLQASRPLTRGELLPALEAALALQGAALIDIAGTYHVVPSKEAARRVPGLRVPGARLNPGYAVQIVPLKFIGAADMEKLLQPLAPEGGIVRVDDARNLLMLAGSSQQLSNMLQIVETFDVDWLAGMSFALLPVEYVDVKTLTEELETIFSGAKSPIASVVRLVPLTRLNSLMVITHEPKYLQDVQAWVKRLDIGVATPGRRIYVYDVQNGKADDLASSLNRIMSLTEDVPAVDSEPPPRSGFSSSQGLGGGPLGGSVAQPPPSRAQPRQTTVDTGPPGGLKIVPNPENNALLIYATPNEFTVLETALKRLDVQPIQVLLEASLAEVTLNDDLRFGVQWSYQSGEGPIVLSEVASGAVNQAFPGFSYLFNGRSDIRGVLNALENITDVNVVSSPKLLVLNNHEANLQIGDQVPITVQSAVGTVNNNAPIVNSVQLRDTGVILRVTPRANKSGLVLLDIAQEVSDVVPTTSSGIDSPTIQQRKLSSSIAVRDGETIALGGLIRDTRSKSRGGVPLLRRIPVLGALFGTTGTNSRRTELIVLITPRVIRSSADAENVMDELRTEFKKLRKVVPGWVNPVPDTAP
jgi:general secretion pathway protein D